MRLPRWLTPWRRTPVPQGRHVRTTAPVAVPGAASALVASAAEPVLTAERPTGSAPAPGPTKPTGPATASADAAAPAAELDDVPLGGTQQVDAVASRPAQAQPWVDAGGGAVSLGFADGAEVRLEADDPRVAALRAAADAVLGEP